MSGTGIHPGGDVHLVQLELAIKHTVANWVKQPHMHQVVAWSEERQESKYSKDLLQLMNGVKIPPTGHKCMRCELTENLWLNLTDGAMLCGRKNFDGMLTAFSKRIDFRPCYP